MKASATWKNEEKEELREKKWIADAEELVGFGGGDASVGG
jgi:hypothetical protein